MHINIIPVLATGLTQVLHLPASTQDLKIVSMNSKFVDMPVIAGADFVYHSVQVPNAVHIRDI